MPHRHRVRATPRTEVHVRTTGHYHLFSPPLEPDPIPGGRIWLGEEGPTKSDRGVDGAGDGEPMPGMGARGTAGAAGARCGAGGAAAGAGLAGAATLRALGFAFLTTDLFAALFFAAELFFVRPGAAFFAFFVFLVFDFVSLAIIVLPIVSAQVSVQFNRSALRRPTHLQAA